jgi:hypothetical protein
LPGRVAPRYRGRPLGASAAQRADVLKRHKAGQSLRVIARATRLLFGTVRTIVKHGDREAQRINELRRREVDRVRAARYRARKKARDQLPAQIAELQRAGEALIKEAKGLGKA